MNYRSTRDGGRPVALSQAIREGLAGDGGLYVPVSMPQIDRSKLAGRETLRAVATPLLRPFFAGDPLSERLDEILDEAFDFPAPLADEGPGRPPVLELFHGPTAAFKDFGARFLAACLARIPRRDTRPLTILVATSGDTGGAVAAAFHRRPGFQVALLYPQGGVSALQERQLCCWDDNVRSFAVRGRFDDCQRLAKQAMADAELGAALALSSANSINVGRLLPQMASFASASLQIRAERGRAAGFVVPSGNLGHAVACAWAREAGLPIGGILLAHNANRAVPDYFDEGRWRPRPSVATIANAMDVGDPSNMERLRDLYPDHDRLVKRFSAVAIDDDAIRARIRADAQSPGRVLCPHTAVAAEAWQRMTEVERDRFDWAIVATAHPAKFPEIVEPLIGRRLEPPPSLAQLLERPLRRTDIDADLTTLRRELLTA
jgi:threonine synthase